MATNKTLVTYLLNQLVQGLPLFEQAEGHREGATEGSYQRSVEKTRGFRDTS